MTAVTWNVSHRYVVGLSVDPGINTIFVPWSADPIFSASLPWATPEYPTLLIYSLGVTSTLSGAVGARRLGITIDQPFGGQTQWISSGSQNSASRRWEVAVGFNLETTATGTGSTTVFREPLPRGLFVQPGRVGGSEGQITVTIVNALAGDVLGPLSIRGALLYPS